MFNIKGRSLTTLLDFSTIEIQELINLSIDLKKQKYLGVINQPLKGKNVVLLFQKDSTRTRCAFEVAAADLGMSATYLGPSGSQFGKKESVEDSAQVLGRMYDGIQFRGYKHSDVECLAKYANVPVWNGLTDDYHPTQMIADFMTVQEKKGSFKKLKFVFVGDAQNNVANSLMITASKLGIDFVALAPVDRFPKKELVKKCQSFAKESGGSVTLESDITKAVSQADVIYTDVWVSMGESDWSERLTSLHQYQVNEKMMQLAKKDCLFMHCLPAFHNTDTEKSLQMAQKYGKEFPNVKNGEFEVTDAVFRSANSVVFTEAENRLHSIKAIMLATIGY